MEKWNCVKVVLVYDFLIKNPNVHVNVPGYSIIRCDSENRNTGGAILYVRCDVKYEILLTKK